MSPSVGRRGESLELHNDAVSVYAHVTLGLIKHVSNEKRRAAGVNKFRELARGVARKKFLHPSPIRCIHSNCGKSSNALLKIGNDIHEGRVIVIEFALLACL